MNTYREKSLSGTWNLLLPERSAPAVCNLQGGKMYRVLIAEDDEAIIASAIKKSKKTGYLYQSRKKYMKFL